MESRDSNVSSTSTQMSAEEIFGAGRIKYILLILGTLFELLMLLVVGLRLYTKHYILRRWTFDDVTIVIAALSTTLYYIVGCFAVTYAASSSAAAGQVTDALFISTWLTEWLSALAFTFTKLSFFILYLQVFRPIRGLRIAAWIGAAYCTLLWSFIFFFNLIGVTPKPGQSWAEASTSWASHANHTLVLIAGPFDVVSDIQILAIPLIGLRKLNMHGKKKAGVLAIVLTGLLALAASILCLYIRICYRLESAKQLSFYAVTACVIIELQIGVFCASLPAVNALLRKKLANWDSSAQDRSATYIRKRQAGMPMSRSASVPGKTSNSLQDPETGLKQHKAAVTIQELTRSDSGELSLPSTHTDIDFAPPMGRSRAWSRSTRHSLLEYTPSPGPSSHIDMLGNDKSARASRRGSLLRAASPWGKRRNDSEEACSLAALGSNILVSTEVRQVTRSNSLSGADFDAYGDHGVRTVIESPRYGPRRVESQIIEAMEGAYGRGYNNGHFPTDPRAGWLDQ